MSTVEGFPEPQETWFQAGVTAERERIIELLEMYYIRDAEIAIKLIKSDYKNTQKGEKE